MTTKTGFGEVRLFDDFIGATLDGRIAGVAENSGTAAIIVAQEGGKATCTTGTTTGNRAHLSAGLNWQAENGTLVLEVLFEPKTGVATVAYFVGWTDNVGQEMPIELGASDAITSTAVDAVGFVYDTASATDRWGCVGVDTNVDTTVTFLSAAQGGTPVVDTQQCLRVVVNVDGTAEFYMDGKHIVTKENAVSPDISLSPIVCVETRAEAARTAYSDYIFATGGRA